MKLKSYFLNLTVLFIFLTIGNLSAQDICKEVDEFEDKEYILADGTAIYANDSQKDGMLLRFFFKKDNNGQIVPNIFYAKVVGTGCVDTGSTLAIIFENGEKISLNNWKKFNCDGVVYFNVKKKELELFRSVNMEKIKFTNTRKYTSVTNTAIEEGDFFVQMFKNLDKINETGIIENCPKEE